MPQDMAKSLYLATPTSQELTTAVITDMSWLVHIQENASMMVLGMEKLQNAVQQGEVSMMPKFNLQDLPFCTSTLNSQVP